MTATTAARVTGVVAGVGMFLTLENVEGIVFDVLLK